MLTAHKLNDVLATLGTCRYKFANKIGISPERLSRHFPPNRPATRPSLNMMLAMIAGSGGLISLADFGFKSYDQRCPLCHREVSKVQNQTAALEAVVAWQSELRGQASSSRNQ